MILMDLAITQDIEKFNIIGMLPAYIGETMKLKTFLVDNFMRD